MPQDTHSHHSPFGGLPLPEISAAKAAHVDKLSSLGVFDAEQLLGIVAAMGGRKELAAAAGLSEDEVGALVDAASKALPPHVVQDLSVAQHIKYPLGALDHNDKTRADVKSHLAQFPDLLAPVPVGAPLPSAVNHISGMEPVQNQGGRGTCVGFGSTALHEYFAYLPHHLKTKFSEEFIYDMCKKTDGHAAECGTWLLYAVRAFAQYGQCQERWLSYNPNLPCNHADSLTPAIMQNAALYHSSPTYYANPKDVNGLKTALALRNSNAGFCIPVYRSWYQSPTVARTGQITMPLSGDPVVGGHCMCFVGYQDNAAYPGGGYFILRNSWGTGWAYQSPYGAGYGTIPFAYISGHCTEAASY